MLGYGITTRKLINKKRRAPSNRVLETTTRYVISAKSLAEYARKSRPKVEAIILQALELDFMIFYEFFIKMGKRKSIPMEWRGAINELQNRFEPFIAEAKEYKSNNMVQEHGEIMSLIKEDLTEFIIEFILSQKFFVKFVLKVPRDLSTLLPTDAETK